jgi:TRAP-type C4-dicarboxylate transport system permease small subunit
LLFEHISSSTELIVLVFLAMVFLGAIIVTTGSGI